MGKTMNGLNVLLIATSFFGYEKKMKEAIEKNGAIVNYYDERSIKSSYEKALLKLTPQIFKKKTIAYYKTIIAENKKTNYDIVYIYGATMIDSYIMELIRNNINAKKYVLYLADSVKNNRRYESLFAYFDKVVTFDRGDFNYYKAQYKNIHFLPLFYCDEYKGDIKNKSNTNYDLLFVGTIHSDRINFLEKIKSEADKYHLSTFYYCYLPSKFMYYYYCLKSKSFRRYKKDYFQYKKVNAQYVRDLMSMSKIIIDAQYPRNTGLTMRTIETLGMKRKLITANKDIVNYDFYNRKNICIVDRNNPQFSMDFIREPYVEVEGKIYNSYYIDNWIKKLLLD